MRKIGLFAFGLTTLVLVPAAVHHLSAGQKEVAKLVAPEQRQLQLGDATIDITSDRALVEAGGKVRVKLVASASTAHRVTVELVVMESIGANGGRTEAPPNRVGRETVTLQAAPGGGAPKEIAFTLRGEVGSSIGGNDRYGKYTILAMEPKAANKLVALHDRANRRYKPEQRDDAFFDAYGAVGRGVETDEGDEAPRKIGSSARLEIATHAKDPNVDIHAPSTVQVGRPFDVAVTVRNPGKEPMVATHIELDTSTTYFDKPETEAAYSLISDTQNGDEHVTLDIPAHSSKTVFFHITPTAPGLIPLFAHVSHNTPDAYEGYDMDNSGTLDAVEILPSEDPPQVVGAAD